MTSDEFKGLLESTVDAKFAEIIARKDPKDAYLTYIDSITMTTAVRNVFKHKLKLVPPQIEASCRMSEAVMAPSGKERETLLKGVIAISGGVSGLAMIIGGVGAALGWGAGVVATVTAFFVGVPMAGPVGWIAGGVALAAVAGYFALSGSPTKDTERFIGVLKNTLMNSVDAIWDEHGAALGAVQESNS